MTSWFPFIAVSWDRLEEAEISPNLPQVCHLHAVCSQQHTTVLQLSISVLLWHSAWNEYVEERQQENEGKGHVEVKMCADAWEWMVSFNWRNLKQFLQEKASSVFT